MSVERQGDPGTPWSVRFRRERQAAWQELEEIVARCEAHGLPALDAERLARLPLLYRSALSALGVARASVLDRGLIDYLDALVARAYLWVHAPRRSALQVAGQYLTAAFPAAVRGIRWQVGIAGAVLLLGAALAFALVVHDQDNYWYFVPAAMAQGRDPGAATEELRATLFDDGGAGLTTFAVFLFTHNSSVAILTYGLGFLFGVPALLLLLYTGLMIGAMSALFHDRGLAVEWWSWILPHGVTELLAICLCGGAALAVSQRLVFPGRLPRSVELAAVGRAMGAVVAGSVGMLLVAGMIEGIFRQAVQELALRYGLAAVLALCWAAYFARCGRGRT